MAGRSLPFSGIALAVALSACASTSGTLSPVDSTEARALANGLSEAIGRCWFNDNEPDFAGYIYTPENVGGQQRILLASRSNPGGRPVLVLQPLNGSDVEVFGPLLEGPLGTRIRADIDRWRTGGTGCGR